MSAEDGSNLGKVSDRDIRLHPILGNTADALKGFSNPSYALFKTPTVMDAISLTMVRMRHVRGVKLNVEDAKLSVMRLLQNSIAHTYLSGRIAEDEILATPEQTYSLYEAAYPRNPTYTSYLGFENGVNRVVQPSGIILRNTPDEILVTGASLYSASSRPLSKRSLADRTRFQALADPATIQSMLLSPTMDRFKFRRNLGKIISEEGKPIRVDRRPYVVVNIQPTSREDETDFRTQNKHQWYSPVTYAELTSVTDALLIDFNVK